MKYKYNKSHQSKEMAEKYDKVVGNRFENVIYDLEKRTIKKVIKKYFNGGVDKYLDFACGTGRITSIVENYSKSSTGVDISEEMLRIAKQKCKKTRFIRKDILSDEKFNEKFNLITSFRFFLNADDTLRRAVLERLRKNLNDEGYLVFNIHMNRYSLIGFQFFLRKILFKSKVINTMSLYYTKKILKEKGYKIVEIIPLAHIPGRLNFILLPKNMLKRLLTVCY